MWVEAKTQINEIDRDTFSQGKYANTALSD